MHHLLDISDLDRAELESLLDDSDGFVEVLARPIPKVPALRGRRHHRLLRGVHPDQALLRAGGQGPVGRHHDVLPGDARR